VKARRRAVCFRVCLCFCFFLCFIVDITWRLTECSLTATRWRHQESNMTEEEYRELTLTPRQAAYQIREHGVDPEEFYQEIGTKETYSGDEVLDWLGY